MDVHRFSGLTVKDFENVSKTIIDVQRDLMKMFSSETILLGHSLESDMRTLKVCSILFFFFFFFFCLITVLIVISSNSNSYMVF